MSFRHYREESRKGWGVELPEGTTIDREQIALGATLRIADALEKLAIGSREWEARATSAERALEQSRETLRSLERSNRALRGVVTRKTHEVAALERTIVSSIDLEPEVDFLRGFVRDAVRARDASGKLPPILEESLEVVVERYPAIVADFATPLEEPAP